MKKNLLLVLFIAVVTQFSFAQKNQENLLDLTDARIENCTLEEGKTVISYSHSGKIYIPLENYEGIKGFVLNYTNFEKLGDANNSVGSINVIYTDEDGNEKKASWGFFRKGKKNVYFDAFEIDSKKTTVEIDPSLIKEVYLGIGKNKKVDITVGLIK